MRHIPSLDGLRGLAILLVIGYHYFGFVPPFAFGWSGVDLFFVLSGYLITGRLWSTAGQPGYFRKFYRNRILRIFPLYFATLILFFIGIHFFTKPSTQSLLAWYHSHWLSYFLFFVNWTIIVHGGPDAPYLTHFWSLSVEEQFYLFWPAVIYWLKGRNRQLVFLSFLLLALVAVRCSFFCWGPKQVGDPFFYFNTFFRMDSLILGALLYRLHQDARPIPFRIFTTLFATTFGILTIAVLTIYPPDPWHPFFETIGYTVIAFFAACLIHWVVQYPGTISAKAFATPALRFVGRISFGLYIFHWLILQIFHSRFLGWYLHQFPGDGARASLMSSLLCLLLTFAISILSYYFFESPFLRMKRGK